MFNNDRTPLVSPLDDPGYHTKSYVRQIGHRWSPASADEVKAFAEECFARAEELASVLAGYADENDTPVREAKRALAVLDDLLFFGYGMLEFWPEKPDVPEGPSHGQSRPPLEASPDSLEALDIDDLRWLIHVAIDYVEEACDTLAVEMGEEPSTGVSTGGATGR